MKRLSTRGLAVAEAIGRRERFKTHGALSATAYAHGSGMLTGDDLTRFIHDRNNIDYVVYSYETPIAWTERLSGTVYKVTQKFSVTTSKHQGKLYLL